MTTIKMLLRLIHKQFKYKLVILLILLLFSMFLEIFGLGLLVPTITFVLDDKKSEVYFNFFKKYIGSFENQQILYITLTLLIFTFAFKSIFLTILNFRQNRFFATIKIYLTDLLFRSYVLEKYSFYLKNNISSLIKNITKEVGIVHSLGTTYLSIIVEGAMIVASLLTIIYINPLGTLTIGVFLFCSSFIFFKLYKNRIHLYGEKRKQFDNDLSLLYYESFSNIKEIKVFNKESNINEEHENIIKEQAYLSAYVDFIVQSPRYFLEFISVLALFIFIVISLLTGEEINNLVISIGVFVTAIFKMLPSVNKLLSVSQTINYNKPALDLIYKELKSNRNNAFSEKTLLSKFQYSLELKNVSFRYSERSKNILNGVNYKIKKGDIIGIVGQSGSGKTTLIDLLLGLHIPTDGELIIDGKQFFPEKQKISFISYVPQEINLMDKSIKENIIFFDKNFNQLNFENAIQKSELNDVIQNLPYKENTIIGDKGNNLSGGQRQRIGIARALYKNPQILIFDEGTSSLDSTTEQKVMESLYKLKGELTIIIISHRTETLKSCDKIIEIDNGKLIPLKE